ncbi:unnamed protein product (macronuclear) [Paramecium tetraurelia]|uniref:Uncharacterized protein n=1 Tax=Paramecium tetraurelia TaxID=5888 RepID=A0E8J2_PARTE|nr:uncharacterized protein GSPATT00024338001 [Paramecium tetraurelia]CAK91609.1 unnamed protein product [Paramecium tetraurelia]|eukprot:XP_001459006.1 hypothetical protein (macronuclear) [Paramecium tetraurelia strain d4-2]
MSSYKIIESNEYSLLFDQTQKSKAFGRVSVISDQTIQIIIKLDFTNKKYKFQLKIYCDFFNIITFEHIPCKQLLAKFQSKKKYEFISIFNTLVKINNILRMFTNALLQIQQIIDNNYDLQLIKETVMNLKNANQVEIMALMEIILQQMSSSFNHEKEAQFLDLLKELQYLLQNKFTTLCVTSANTNNFLEYKNKCNSQNKGILLLNHQGQFILSDQISRNIVELNSKKELKQKDFFSLVSQASKGKLKKTLQKCCLLSNGKSMDSFQLAIHSDRNRKKSLKYLNQIASNNKKVEKIKAEKNVQEMKKEQILVAKYLKSIEVTIYQATLQFDKEFIEQFSKSDDIILSNLDSLNNTNANQLAICEVKEIDEQLKFTEKELLSDDYISKHETKWDKRVKKMKVQKSD